jgi:hypothetical protein
METKVMKNKDNNENNDLDINHLLEQVLQFEEEMNKAKKHYNDASKKYEHAKRLLRNTCSHATYKVVSDHDYHKPGYLYVCETCALIMTKRPLPREPRD